MRTTTSDVVVVGAGGVGAATATGLSGAGLRVAVLDAGAVNREGSGTTAGNLHIQAIHPSRPGQAVPADSARFLPLQREASQRWDDLAALAGDRVGLRRTGGFTVAETDADVADLEHKHRLEQAAGIPTEILRGDDLRAAAPLLAPDLPAATWCPWDGYANPLGVTGALLDVARARGATVHPFRPVTGLRRAGTGWAVDTPAGTIHAGSVVVASGPALPAVTALCGVDLAATPAILQMHVTVRMPPLLPHLVQHISKGLSVKQVAAGQVLIGGGWPGSPSVRAGRPEVSTASLGGNVDLAIRVLPVLAGIDLLRVWSGPVLATADEMPVVGELPGAPGLFVCGGTYAFTLAPLWADVLTALVTGDDIPVPIDDLGPERLLLGPVPAP